MDGWTGSNRMDKKVQRAGKAANPYAGPVETFEEEFFLRLTDFQEFAIRTGPFAGRSPMQIYRDHVVNGWRPVSVDPLALDCAFAKQLGRSEERRVGKACVSPCRSRWSLYH